MFTVKAIQNANAFFLKNPMWMFTIPLTAIILFATTVALTACGGGFGTGALSALGGQLSGARTTVWPQALPEDQAQPWEQLDTQGRVIVSINEQSEFVPGVERYLENGDVVDLGETSRLNSGNAGDKQLSYAMYRVNHGTAQPGVVCVDANLRLQTGGSGLSGYYVGLSDYTRGRWDWYGPYTDSHVRISTGFAAHWGLDYTSTLGNLFVCIVAYDGAAFDIVGVGTNTLDTADYTAPAVPTGLTATPVAQGLLLQWNDVIAGDLAGYRIYWKLGSFTAVGEAGVVKLNYVEGLTQHLLLTGLLGSHSVAVAAVDFSGNESAICPVISASPLPGTVPELEVLLDTASVELAGVANLTATGATEYDFDLDGDGSYDLTNATGLASVVTTQPGLIRPLVRGTANGGTCQAMGGVSLIVTGNTRPVASATASPQQGVCPLGVTFSGIAEDLEDGTVGLTYAWDFNGDGTYEPGTNSLAPPVYTFSSAGLYNVKFRVTDSQGAWDVDSIAIDVQPRTGVDGTIVIGSPSIRGRASATLVGGLAAIAYQDNATFDIYYIRAARPDATTWGSRVLAVDEDEAVDYISLIIVNGNPAIAYGTSLTGDLIYIRATTPQGSAWGVPVTVVSAGTVGANCEMVIAAGNPGIGYYNATSTQSYFVRAIDADGAAWMAPAVVDAPNTGYQCSTAIVNGYPAMLHSENPGTKTLYSRATDAAGSAWGAHVELSTAGPSLAMDLQVIAGVPCAAFGGPAAGVVYFCRAADINGSTWLPQQIAVRGSAGAMNAQEITVSEFDGHAVMAILDTSPDFIWYSEAKDPTGFNWELPEIIAPYDPGDTANGRPALLNLNGTAGIVFRLFESSSMIDQLYLCRRYR